MISFEDEKRNNVNINETKGIVVATGGEKVYSGEGYESATSDSKRIDLLEEKTNELGKKAKYIEKSLERSEKNQAKALNFMMILVSAIAVAFFLALIPLLFDYYRNNTERYEKFTKRIDDLNMRVKILENKTK